MKNFFKKVRAFFDPVIRFFRTKPMRVIGKILGVLTKIVATILLIGVITVCIVGCVMTVYVFNTFSNSQEVPDISRIIDTGTSIVYVQNDKGEWVENQRLEGVNRIWTDLPDVPEHLQNAVIAIEDERFWQHQGVDWRRTTAAVVNKLLGGSSEFGGSTITQQLIKVVTEDNDVTIERKIREIFRAIEMERDYYTKDEILEAYLNILPLSDNVVGVGAAANYYFAKEVEDLTLAECAVIAGVTNLPAYYDPYEYPAHAKERQEVILAKMHELGMITDDEYIQACGEELVYKSSARYVEIQDYYVDQLIEDIIADLQDTYGYNYNYAEQLVYFGGLRIYSYENPTVQNTMESYFNDPDNFPDIEGDDNKLQAGLFIMDYDGRVVATVGGRGRKEANRLESRATTSQRQPGSAIKPLGVYAPAIDLDIVNYSTIVRDAPIKVNGESWPHNFGMSASDRGWKTVQYALEDSLNTVPVRILEEMGIDVGYEFLTEKLHFTSLVEEDAAYAPLALGGFTYGVTVREMAAGYQIFGNSGYYNKPHTYKKVVFEEEVLLEHIPENEQAISPESATIMNRLLQKVVSRGTGSAISGYWDDIEVFAKTGTTDNNKDSYFAGGTPYYVGAIWMGYDDNQEMTDSQRAEAKMLWNKCMLYLHEDLEGKSFDLWGDVVGAYYSTGSGIAGGGGAYGYYKAGEVPYGVNSMGGVSYGSDTTTKKKTTKTTVTTTETTKKTRKTRKTTTTLEEEEITKKTTVTTEATDPPTTKPTDPPTTKPTDPPTTQPTDPPTTEPTDPPTTTPPEPLDEILTDDPTEETEAPLSEEETASLLNDTGEADIATAMADDAAQDVTDDSAVDE